jgi:hypothetical protein
LGSTHTKGIFRKKVTGRTVTTNRKIVVDYYELLLSEISDVEVLNRHRSSQAYYTNYNIRSGGSPRTGAGGGNIQSRSYAIGDLIIIIPNRTEVIIRSVQTVKV